jgi:O-6-methylguanine DNA methyltransferase
MQVAPADAAALENATAELKEYFQGRLAQFTVPVELEGPPFHRKVWDVLRSIAFGQVLTYSEIARRLGSPGAARAVGNACARNPVAIIVPCPRVLARNGLGGFGGGLEAKRWLLRHENYTLPDRY